MWKIVTNIYKFNWKKLQKNQENKINVFKNSHLEIELIYSNQIQLDWMQDKKIENVFLIKGWAILEDKNQHKIKMKKGDLLTININYSHRIIKTARRTIWVAILSK
ncbi:hypothetical protein VBM87_01665 [Mycoplasma sp. 744]|uniref:hypothetical protein n=1 Tax=Mycoplasma sp. 744 TaxID=3108531 RepID=UPI002B1D2717|nr:hypothetical protein [Mycoplasma sp. 744]MEA4115487.1 hypothetical protein [Mycoplasma sp. 744]